MLKTAGIQKPPAYFKLDVEGFEYDIFTEMMQSPDLLPRQIQVELHWGTRMTGLSWMPRLRTSGEIALMAGMMFHGGFLPVHCIDGRNDVSWRISASASGFQPVLYSLHGSIIL